MAHFFTSLFSSSSDKHGVLEYDQITSYIFIGTNQCCQTHFEEELLARKITADISLEQERIDAPFGVDYYTWIPVVDHTPPTKSQLDFGVSSLDSLISMKKKVYVHCKNGHGRAPTLVAAYLISRGKGVDEAIAYIQERRPSIHLEASQVRALKRFAKSLSK